jgi:type I restriction enzyme S subunit
MKLKDIAIYVKDRVEIEKLSLHNYISTENMLPEKGGVQTASSLPSISMTSGFRKDDILTSNIRPYFKKIWIANKEGGCSNDVLVLRAKNNCHPKFLYYVLSENRFFDYSTASAKGTKMPRGDKSAIMEYKVPDYCVPEQIQIADILSSLDDKIAFNKRINDNLEQQVQIMFDQHLVNNTATEFCRLSDIANINPKRTLSKNTKARYIEMSDLPTKGSFPSGWKYKEFIGGMKFTNCDTIMARITPCLENGKVAYINFLDKGEVAFGSTEYIVISTKGLYSPEWFYFLTRNKTFVDYSIKHMNGSSGRQRVSGESIGDFQLPLFSKDSLKPIFSMAESALKIITRNSLENIELSAIRDSLLPKLMSGELKVNDLNN